MDTPTATAPTATVTLPGGQTIAPDQVNIGTQTAPNIINTSSASRNTTNQSSAALNNALSMFNIGNGQTPNTGNTGTGTPTNPTAPITPNTGTDTTTTPDASDPYVQTLNQISSNSNASTQMLVNSILTAKTQQSNAADKQYTAYKQGLQLLGIEHNAAQSTPDLLAGQVNAAEDEHQQKLQTIQSNTAKALATAQTAQENNDFKTLNAQMAYVKELNTEKVQALKDYQTSLTTQPKIAADVAHNVYTTMQTLDPADQEAFIQQVSQQYGLPLGTLVTALTDEQAKVTTAATKATTAQATADAKTVLSPAEAKTLGVPYGTTTAEAQKMGIVPATGKTGKAASTASITKEMIANMQSRLTDETPVDPTTGKPDPSSTYSVSKGGYVDPYAYQSAYQQWAQAGGTTKAFLTAFPPSDYVSTSFVSQAPSSYPSYLLPKTAKASASGGSRTS